MIEGSRPQVLTDAQWEVLAPLIEACRPPHKTEHHDLRRTIEAIIWRHDSGAKWRQIPAGLGPWWVRGTAPDAEGWPRRPSVAGRGWAPGSGCWSWRSSVAGSRLGWRSSTAPASEHTTRPQVRRKGGILSRARRTRGARPVARRLPDQGLRDRRGLRSRHRLRPGPWTGARAAAGTAAPDTPLDHPRLDRGRPRVRQPCLPRPHLGPWRPSHDPGQAQRRRRRLSTMDLLQPQSGRASLGAAERVASRGHPLREDRLLLHGGALHGRDHGLDQVAAQKSGTDRPYHYCCTSHFARIF